MRRRLDLAASVVVMPDLWFLDEPTTGLDPHGRRHVWDIVRSLVAGGTTVLLTTQYLDEADHLADRIAVIDHGTLIAQGTSTDLKASIGAGTLHVLLRDPERHSDAEQILARSLGVQVNYDSVSTGLSAPASNSEHAVSALARLAEAEIVLAGFSLARPSLDDVYLALTGRPHDDRTTSQTTTQELV